MYRGFFMIEEDVDSDSERTKSRSCERLRPASGCQPQKRRRLALYDHFAARAGMNEFQFRGMKVVSGVAGQGFGIRRREAAGSIELIAH